MWLVWVIATHPLKYLWAVLLSLIRPRYFPAIKSTDQHQGERLVEAKELHQNSFQRSGRSYLKTLFLQKLWQKLEKCERYFCGSGQTQRTAGSAAKASFNASMAVLTIGTVITYHPFSMLAEMF